MPIKRKKLDADVPEPPRWMKMMACAQDMEELLVEFDTFASRYLCDDLEAVHLRAKIARLFVRTGRVL